MLLALIQTPRVHSLEALPEPVDPHLKEVWQLVVGLGQLVVGLGGYRSTGQMTAWLCGSNSGVVSTSAGAGRLVRGGRAPGR